MMLLFIACGERLPELEGIPLSNLSFEQIERELVGGGLTSNQLESYSKSVRGKKVQWKGQVKRLEGELVFLAIEGEFPNVEFRLSEDIVTKLKVGQSLTVTGLVESVSLAHTSPPMPKAYVTLQHVQPERHSSNL
jgi:hypothetical protein